MNQLIIVENGLPISADLCNMFEKRNITLTKLSDFFIHIVVPSRSNVILEEIDFVDELHVKAIAMTSRGPGVLYYLEKKEDSWWITIF